MRVELNRRTIIADGRGGIADDQIVVAAEVVAKIGVRGIERCGVLQALEFDPVSEPGHYDLTRSQQRIDSGEHKGNAGDQPLSSRCESNLHSQGPRVLRFVYALPEAGGRCSSTSPPSSTSSSCTADSSR